MSSIIKALTGLDIQINNETAVSVASNKDVTFAGSIPSVGTINATGSINAQSFIGDGSGLTSINPFTYTATTNPLFSSNPNAVGDSWFNSSSGEVFYCVDATTDANVWQGTNGSTVAPVLSLYNYGDKNIPLTGDWSWNYTNSNSSHSVTYNADNVYILCTGSGGTGIGIYTRWYTNNPITIPTWANTLEVYCYVVVKDSNNNDSAGSIVHGLGTTQTNLSAIQFDLASVLGAQDGLYNTAELDISGLRGQSLYFTSFGAGGQYANVQYQIYSVKIKG